MKTLPLSFIEDTHEWPSWRASVSVDKLLELIQQIHGGHGQLLTLWGTDERFQDAGFRLHLAFVYWNTGVLYLQCDLSKDNPSYPSLSAYFPVADRLQRALFDLLGLQAEGSEDKRPWLRHNAWPADVFPLRDDVKLTQSFARDQEAYPFIRVPGEGVHDIPVGPVHAGIIEPGHFRFQVVGERILALEERLGYTHKGVAKHFQHCHVRKGALLAGRICGDSTVAYAWAFSMAVEHAHALKIPPRAQWFRALLLERERTMNHIGDLGGIANDAGLGFLLTQCSILKEDMLRLNGKLFGHRYLMDLITPGGVTVDLDVDGIQALSKEIKTLSKETEALLKCYTHHEGLQERISTTGMVSTEWAKKFGMLGLPARASGVPIDWRTKFRPAPYDHISTRIRGETIGDIAARVSVRFQEIKKSLRIMDEILTTLPEGTLQESLPAQQAFSSIGLGCVEGWRGPVFFAIGYESKDLIRWAHVHDPSWQNWPVLEKAILANIVPDFPLVNKSFNLSYSGHDG